MTFAGHTANKYALILSSNRFGKLVLRVGEGFPLLGQ